MENWMKIWISSFSFPSPVLFCDFLSLVSSFFFFRNLLNLLEHRSTRVYRKKKSWSFVKLRRPPMLVKKIREQFLSSNNFRSARTGIWRNFFWRRIIHFLDAGPSSSLERHWSLTRLRILGNSAFLSWISLVCEWRKGRRGGHICYEIEKWSSKVSCALKNEIPVFKLDNFHR